MEKTQNKTKGLNIRKKLILATVVLNSSEMLDSIVDENTASINEVAASVDEIARGSSELLNLQYLLKSQRTN